MKKQKPKSKPAPKPDALDLLEVLQGTLDDADKTGCEDCAVISGAQLKKIEAAIRAATKGARRAAKPQHVIDQAAVYAIAASLDRFTQKGGLSGFKMDVSRVYSGGDQFMREIMKTGAQFETWANAHVDFTQLDDVWPYMLQDKFATALEAARPGAVLILNHLTPEDFAAVAKQLGLVLNTQA